MESAFLIKRQSPGSGNLAPNLLLLLHEVDVAGVDQIGVCPAVNSGDIDFASLRVMAITSKSEGDDRCQVGKDVGQEWSHAA